MTEILRGVYPERVEGLRMTLQGDWDITSRLEALYDYSPYHRVKRGTNYPAILFTAGENDGRVLAYHSRKMTALLQDASASNKLILLPTNTSGHGIDTALDEQVSEDADVFAFFASPLDS